MDESVSSSSENEKSTPLSVEKAIKEKQIELNALQELMKKKEGLQQSVAGGMESPAEKIYDTALNTPVGKIVSSKIGTDGVSSLKKIVKVVSSEKELGFGDILEVLKNIGGVIKGAFSSFATSLTKIPYLGGLIGGIFGLTNFSGKEQNSSPKINNVFAKEFTPYQGSILQKLKEEVASRESPKSGGKYFDNQYDAYNRGSVGIYGPSLNKKPITQMSFKEVNKLQGPPYNGLYHLNAVGKYLQRWGVETQFKKI